jgi:hypothetical protein
MDMEAEYTIVRKSPKALYSRSVFLYLLKVKTMGRNKWKKPKPNN